MPEPRLIVYLRPAKDGMECCIGAPDGPVTINSGEVMVVQWPLRAVLQTLGEISLWLRTFGSGL